MSYSFNNLVKHFFLVHQLLTPCVCEVMDDVVGVPAFNFKHCLCMLFSLENIFDLYTTDTCLSFWVK